MRTHYRRAVIDRPAPYLVKLFIRRSVVLFRLFSCGIEWQDLRALRPIFILRGLNRFEDIGGVNDRVPMVIKLNDVIGVHQSYSLFFSGRVVGPQCV